MSSLPERPEDERITEGDDRLENSRAKPLKRYEAPRLELYGKLHEVTQFGGSGVVDSGAGLGRP